MDTNRSYLTSRPHPWHGVENGEHAPKIVNAFIEMTPFDHVKLEINKENGYLFIDRPQLMSSLPPTPYGIIPRTLCAKEVAKLMDGANKGDMDPLDICIFSERAIPRGDVFLKAKVIGGIPMLDKGLADDKIIAVLENDPLWGDVEDIKELPGKLIKRQTHYFTTYKTIPGEKTTVSVGNPYGADHARSVIRAAIVDYYNFFGLKR
ncbi:inorganic pyrophosphatase [Chitinispirillales bacterium ANBcel5]|uniref:inorganic pyrophosphatase n=1 Tax=Cellulosispirillum alkaliphilum TaxID=3039283 RepID=UPI002A53AA5D|nr:inorganic pyrophosphatase [Chitinispirillales bacterium ANBcel5]